MPRLHELFLGWQRLLHDDKPPEVDVLKPHDG